MASSHIGPPMCPHNLSWSCPSFRSEFTRHCKSEERARCELRQKQPLRNGFLRTKWESCQLMMWHDMQSTLIEHWQLQKVTSEIEQQSVSNFHCKMTSTLKSKCSSNFTTWKTEKRRRNRKENIQVSQHRLKNDKRQAGPSVTCQTYFRVGTRPYKWLVASQRQNGSCCLKNWCLVGCNGSEGRLYGL